MNNTGYTENGAVTHKSTLNGLLDLFAMGAAARTRDITHLFTAAHAEDRNRAIKMFFYIRDVRGGQGERQTFRNALNWLYKNDRAAFDAVFHLVPVYGRWDDILNYVEHSGVVSFVAATLENDLAIARGEVKGNASLLAKWMPSENASSKNTKRMAYAWMNALGISARDYRKVLSSIREYLNVVERDMSAKNWSAINYEGVPSVAMKNYRKAFSKQDAERFVAYLDAVKSGEKTIKAATLYPYQIYEAFQKQRWIKDDTLEAQWKALPNYITDAKSFLVLADVSGSMSGTPMAVSVSLALYAAERSKGYFKDYFMTFESNPHLIKVTGNTVAEKMRNIEDSPWGGNTNFQAAFNLILKTAITNKLTQDDLPEVFFVISDMEFDSAGGYTNFAAIDKKFADAGYKRPTMVFWNVQSRNDNVPVTEKEPGVFLVSGLSPVTFKNALNTKVTNPRDLMLEVIDSERYAAIGEALAK